MTKLGIPTALLRLHRELIQPRHLGMAQRTSIRIESDLFLNLDPPPGFTGKSLTFESRFSHVYKTELFSEIWLYIYSS